MKNKVRISVITLILISVFIPETYAACGYAKDGDLFVLALIGFLLLVTGVLFFIDFLRKNGKHLIKKLISHRQIGQKQDYKEPSPTLPDESKNYKLFLTTSPILKLSEK